MDNGLKNADDLLRGIFSHMGNKEYFKGIYPANTLVEITALAEPGLDVEIDAIAVID